MPSTKHFFAVNITDCVVAMMAVLVLSMICLPFATECRKSTTWPEQNLLQSQFGEGDLLGSDIEENIEPKNLSLINLLPDSLPSKFSLVLTASTSKIYGSSFYCNCHIEVVDPPPKGQLPNRRNTLAFSFKS